MTGAGTVSNVQLAAAAGAAPITPSATVAPATNPPRRSLRANRLKRGVCTIDDTILRAPRCEYENRSTSTATIAGLHNHRVIASADHSRFGLMSDTASCRRGFVQAGQAQDCSLSINGRCLRPVVTRSRCWFRQPGTRPGRFIRRTEQAAGDGRLHDPQGRLGIGIAETGKQPAPTLDRRGQGLPEPVRRRGMRRRCQARRTLLAGDDL